MGDLVRLPVTFFLRRFKSLLTTGSIVWIDRDKNRVGLAAIGFTKRNALDEIMELDVDDYCRGPVPDDKGRPWDVWEFGRIINGIEVYIKLSIKETGLGQGVIISFHPAEFKLWFPFKEG